VFVASVDVSLGPDGDELVEVMNVDVNENSKQSRQDLFACRGEIVGKRNVHPHWKERLIVDLFLYPIHQKINVYWRWQWSWLLIVSIWTVTPHVFVFWPPRHDGTGFVRAKVADSSINQVDSVEKIHHMDCKPIAVAFIGRQLDGILQVDSGIKCSLSVFV